MAADEETAPVDNTVLLSRITVSSIFDEDGDQAMTVSYTPDLGISQALGLLEYAKHTLLQTFERGRSD